MYRYSRERIAIVLIVAAIILILSAIYFGDSDGIDTIGAILPRLS